MGGTISWVAIQQYCGYHDLTPDQCEAMRFHLRRLDEAYDEVKSKKDG